VRDRDAAILRLPHAVTDKNGGEHARDINTSAVSAKVRKAGALKTRANVRAHSLGEI